MLKPILAISFLFTCSTSFASEHMIGELITDSVKLRGEGIRNPKSNEKLYLACTETNDQCEEMQFILAKPNGNAYWWSQAFRVNNYKQFKKIMKNLNWASTPSQNGLHKFSEIFGTTVVFGGAGVVAATVSLGAGALAFAVAVMIVSKSERNWESFDFLTYLPIQTTKMISEDTLTETQNKNGWGWSVNSHRLRSNKFIRIKKLLSHPENFGIEQGTINGSYSPTGFLHYLYDEGDVEWAKE